MADNKDFLLGNKARELLCYTKHATKIVSDDASRAVRSTQPAWWPTSAG